MPAPTGIDNFIQGSRQDVTLPSSGNQAARLLAFKGYVRDGETIHTDLHKLIALGSFEYVLGDETVDADTAVAGDKVRVEINDSPLYINPIDPTNAERRTHISFTAGSDFAITLEAHKRA